MIALSLFVLAVATDARAAEWDFNNDSKSDILWRNDDGTVALWFMDGTLMASGGVPGTLPATVTILGVGDFDNDGHADILLRDTSGDVRIWFMNGSVIASQGPVGNIGLEWAVARVGDFNGDHKADILWWNPTTGAVKIWLMDGLTVTAQSVIGNAPPDWIPRYVGDFNGDTKADILWRRTSGEVAVWFLDGLNIIGSAFVGTVPTTFFIAGVGDFNNDGRVDILWRSGTGEVAIWLLDATGAAIQAGGVVGTVPLDWAIAGVRDFSGDGKADILWRRNTGEVAVWLMDGLSLAAGGVPGTAPTTWEIAHELEPPEIVNANATTFVVGQAGTFTVYAAGFPTPMITRGGVGLPSNLTYVDNGDRTGTLSGTPAALTSGTYALSFTADNGLDPDSIQNPFTLTVNQAPAITSANSLTFQQNVANSLTVTTTGFPTGALMVISQTGTLPTSVTFTDNHDGTATLAGTTTNGGTFPIVITANNGVTPNATQNFNIIVEQAPAITSANSYTKQIGTALSFNVTTTGAPAPTVSQAPVGGQTGFPAGVTFTPSPGSAAIGGSVTSGGAQTYTTTITANNGVNLPDTQSFSLIITCPTITVTRNGGGAFPAGTYNVAYTGQSVTATGGTGPYSFVVATGALPTNLSLASNGGISGTPSATGTFTFTVTATDSTGCAGTSALLSIAINPVAGSDTYNNLVNNTEAVVTGGSTSTPGTPFVPLTGVVTSNDTPTGGVTITSSNPIATTQGGSVTLAADGTFKYTPPVTVSALSSDTFTYTISSNTGGTAAATTANGTVTLNLSNRVWYVNPNAGSNGNGQSQSPWNSTANIKQQPTVGGANTGDTIFVYNGPTGNLTANIPLKASQTLQGEGVALVVNSVTLRSAGTAPSLTASSANVVSVNDGNTITGVTLTNSTNSLITGSPAGLTVDTVTLTPSGTASGINLTGGSGAVTISNVTMTGTSSGDMLKSNTGTHTWTVTNSPMTQTVGRAINASNRTGGGMSFDSASTITVSAGTTDGAITLTTNSGSETFTFNGKVALTVSGAVRGFLASNSGTVNVVDNTSTLSATGGAALDFQSTTIGASGLKFRSIAANGGTNGIVLNTTGSSGGLTVAGTGSANSGGTIQNTTGAGISLTSTTSPSFNNMNIQTTTKSGVSGTQVTNFTFTNGTINNSGTAGAPVDDRSNIGFGFQTATTENNVSGVVTITGNTLTNATEHGVDIQNFAGTITNAVITGNTVTSSTSAATSLGSGIRLLGFGHAAGVSNITKALIDSNTVTNFPAGAGITAQYGNTAAAIAGTWGTVGSATNRIVISNNLIKGQSSVNPMNTNAILMTLTGAGQANWLADSNGTVADPIANIGGTEIGVTIRGASAVATCDITNNHIQGIVNVGADAIAYAADFNTLNTDAPQLTGTISGNVISGQDGVGIYVLATTNSNAVVNAAVLNNNVGAPNCSGCNRFAIRADSGSGNPSVAGVAATVCLDISGNTATGSGVDTGIGIRRASNGTASYIFNIKNLPGGDGQSPQLETYINGLNPAGAGTTLLSATSGFGSCTAAP
jgi:hypothetical protein